MSYSPRAQATTATEVFISVFVAFGLLSAIVLPSIPLSGLGVYFVTVVSPFVLVFMFSVWQKKVRVHKSAIFPFSLGCMVCIASLHSWVAGYSNVNYRDFVESVKYFQFVPYLCALSVLGKSSLKVFHLAILFSSAWIAFVGFLQVSGVNHALSYIYLGAGSAHIDSVVSGKRITLTGSDPNIGGVIACFLSIYFFSLFAVYKKHVYLMGFFVFFFFCFMTQSRTALIAVLLGLGIYYAFIYKGFLLAKWAVIGLSFAFVVFLIFYLDLSYIYIGVQYALEGRNNSLNVRFENIFMAYERFLASPIIGMGPAKSALDTIVDSEYALILQRYGLVGVSIFFAYISYLLSLAYKNLDSHWGVSLFVFVVMSGMVMFTNNIFSGYQLMSIVVILNVACVLNQRAKMYRTQGL